MKKSTLNALMTGLIICLLLANILLIIKLATRPKTDYQETSEGLIVNQVVEQESVSESAEEEPESEVVIEKRVRIVNDNINVRSGPSTDNDRLGSAYKGYDFELVEQLPEGWTKIIYDGKEAYVFSEYVEVIDMVLDENGNYTEYLGLPGNNSANDSASQNSEVPSEHPQDASPEENTQEQPQ